MSLLTSLISYWQLDEASGSRADSHGSSTLTDNNTVASATGILNSAADFESGNSEWLSAADSTDLSTGDIDFTIACWVNVESFAASTADRTVLAKDDAAGNREYRLWFIGTDGIPHWLVMNNGGANASADWGSALSTGTWYHLVVWHDAAANEIGLVVNAGTPVTAAFANGPADSTAEFVIGRLNEGAGRYFDGLIDEVGFWKRVLTSGERTSLYNGGAGLAYSSFGGGGGAALPVFLNHYRQQGIAA